MHAWNLGVGSANAIGQTTWSGHAYLSHITVPRISVSHRAPLRSVIWTATITAVALLAVGVGVAFAHTALRRSEPARDTRLTAAPREIRLVFTERVAVAVSQIALRGPDSAEVALSAVRNPGDSTSI